MAEHPILSLRNFSVDYVTESGRVRAVDDITLELGRGEIFGLAGESGSGKSTLVRGFMRLLGPPAVISGGEAHLDGVDLLALDEDGLRALRWRKMSMVFQSAMDALNPVLSVGEQIVDAIVAHDSMGRSAALERARELLDMVGIDPDRVRSFPHELSGGMRQRVVIAMALALTPPLIVMDEPTTALDVVVQHEILGQIIALKNELGFSVLFITHDLPLMLELADRIGILYAGRLVEVGPTSRLRAHARHPYTRGLLGAFPPVRGPRQALVGIPGSPANPSRLPPGCPFHPRCPEALERCSLDEPSPVALGPDHIAACHLLSDS